MGKGVRRYRIAFAQLHSRRKLFGYLLLESLQSHCYFTSFEMLWFALRVPETQFAVDLHFCISVAIYILEHESIVTHIALIPFTYMKIACTAEYIKSGASAQPGKKGRQL